ncbi:hypothetical protein Dsin_017089 [Dipteronia sinensis]|uniref:RNase H type-1 domain-containing protein n=1 Tax=Dipteronia sinensis TaxID=43782 RepID=A0AAE0AF92_9ROSI|nr:hypothetical protein Dsin_017089 [Dipteronia sinensis]
MASSVQSINACFSPQAAETSAILRCMCVAVESGLLPAVLESDAKWVVDAINDNCPSSADIGIIFRDILCIVTEFVISVTFVSRKANKAAHALAKLALFADRTFLWKEDCPPCIQYVILDDSLSFFYEVPLSKNKQFMK